MIVFKHATSGRNARTAIVFAGVWLLLILGVAIFSVNSWITGVIGLFTLPALWDLASDRAAGLWLSDDPAPHGRIGWFAGKQEHVLDCDDIRVARFDTRLDFSVRVTLFRQNGKKIRLPQECLPDHRQLEAELQTLGVATERRHFTLL